jgi:hypothetical protein
LRNRNKKRKKKEISKNNNRKKKFKLSKRMLLNREIRSRNSRKMSILKTPMRQSTHKRMRSKCV